MFIAPFCTYSCPYNLAHGVSHCASAALDFASLYPSIMMAHNLCYSTLADPDEVKSGALKPEAIEKTPDENIYFVRAG